jgi:hypothetical protein
MDKSMTFQKSRTVLTLAVGNPIYVQMAINLARSFQWWHPKSTIGFAIVTDHKHLIPSDLADIQILEVQAGEYGQGFSPKLHLDQLAPADQTLFIDADCLCCGPLESVFEQFANRAISVIGSSMSEGEWFGDVATICQKFEVAALPKFNGGVYYLEKGELSDLIYAKARELEPLYDEIGLTRLRGRPNDELLMAIAMALYGQTAIPDDGSIFTDPQACPIELSIDVLRGHSKLVNPPAPHPQHQAWYPVTEAHPTLVHFLGHHTTIYPYTRESLRLSLVAKGWSIWAADFWAMLFCSLPELSLYKFKDLARPAYRRLFGVRPLSVSNRI